MIKRLQLKRGFMLAMARSVRVLAIALLVVLISINTPIILNTLVLFGGFFSVRGMILLARASSRQEKGLARGTTMLIAGVVLGNPVITAIILPT